MMKKLFGLLLALVMICGSGMAVSAEIWYDDYELGTAIPVYTITEITNPATDYNDLLRMAGNNKMQPVYRDGELVGQVNSFIRNGKWIYGQRYREYSVGRLLQNFGKSGIILAYRYDRFVIFPEQQNTLYPLDQFEDESLTSPVPYEYTLTEYIKAATFWEKKSGIEDETYREFQISGFDDALIAIAEEYWGMYLEKDAQNSLTVSICVIGGIAVFLAVLICLILRADKKGKLKITNDIIGKVWIPAICKGVTWRLK